MKRWNIPLSVGIAGVLLLQGACTDPISPDGRAVSEPPQQFVDVLVRNLSDTPFDVSVTIGEEEMKVGVVRGGATQLLRVTPVNRIVGHASFVAVAVAETERLESAPIDVMPGWTVEVALTPRGPVASRYTGSAHECGDDGIGCTR